VVFPGEWKGSKFLKETLAIKGVRQKLRLGWEKVRIEGDTGHLKKNGACIFSMPGERRFLGVENDDVDE